MDQLEIASSTASAIAPALARAKQASACPAEIQYCPQTLPNGNCCITSASAHPSLPLLGPPHCLFFAPQIYAGKYVPSIAHYIYQMDAIVSGKARELDHPRPIPADEIQDPLSKLGGIAIGNGWTGGWRWRTCRVCSVSTPTAAEGDDVGWMSGRVVEAWMDVKIIE